MRIVMLTGTIDEAKTLAELAGLAMSDVLIPRSGEAVRGFTLTDEDLIIEFASWAHVAVERRLAVEGALHMSIARSDSKPLWHVMVAPE